MRTIMARTPHESSASSFSFSRRHFRWRRKVSEDEQDTDDEEEKQEILTFISSSAASSAEKELHISAPIQVDLWRRPRKTRTPIAKLKSAALSLFPAKNNGIGTKVIGTLFGHRRGHVRIAFQDLSRTRPGPAFSIELSMPTSVLVREMASGLVRIALECDKKLEKKGVRLLEEPLWRIYCNGRKCGYAMRRECGAEEWRVLRAVDPITMGAGVLPVVGNPKNENGDGGGGNIRVAAGDDEEASGEGEGEEGGGELMYMRAKFERVVGSKDSEAFYMMNLDGSGCPELSVFLLRV